MDSPFPNPFNPQTGLQFFLQKVTIIQFDIFDLRGIHILRLAEGMYSAGEHRLTWDGRNKHGREVGSGTYVAKLQTDDTIQSRQMMLIR
jgi:flagellar hook assembly protein FlgD